MDISRYTEGKYLKAADLGDAPVYTVIRRTVEDELGGKAKLVLETERGAIVLNVTNARALQAAYGTNSDAWQGQRVKLTQGDTRRPDGTACKGIVVTPGPPLPVKPAPDEIPF